MGPAQIDGVVAPGWSGVRDAFAANFAERGEVGAGLTVRHRGAVVVDLWGGLADPATGRAWTAETACVCFSATKGLVATAFLLLADEGALDLDAPLDRVWPELACGAAVTARTLLNHRSGLSAVDVPLALTDLRDRPDAVRDALSRQVPLWDPGTDQGYMACSYGLYTAELFRRLSGGQSLGSFLAERVAVPLGLGGQLTLGRPGALAVPRARLLPTDRGTLWRAQLPTALFRANADGRLFRRVLLGKRTDAGRALLNPTLGPTRFEALNDDAILGIELPWMNALVSARALATVYAALAGDGAVDGVRLVRPEALPPLHARQSWSERDRVMCKPLGWSQGFLKDEPGMFSAGTAGFGHPGAGGALGWADPERGIAIGYVMNRMDWRIRSPRARALCDAIGAAAAA